MNNIKIGMTGKAPNNSTEINGTIYAYMQPFQEMPSAIDTSSESTDRINAHDLFSFYTADIIREDTIFAR